MINKEIGSGGDYATIDAAKEWLRTQGSLAEEYYFTLVSDVTETEEAWQAIQFDGQTVTFDFNGFTAYLDGVRLGFVALYTGNGKFNLFDATIVQLSAVSGPSLGISGNTSPGLSEHEINVKNLKVHGVSNVAYNKGIAIGGVLNDKVTAVNILVDGFDVGATFSATIAYAPDIPVQKGKTWVIENVSILNCTTGIVAPDYYHNFIFRNVCCVLCDDDFLCTGYAVDPNRGSLTFINCGDSDNTLATNWSNTTPTLTNCITGIIAADFESVIYGNDRFARPTNTGNVFDSGTDPVIYSYDIDGVLYGTGGFFPIGPYMYTPSTPVLVANFTSDVTNTYVGGIVQFANTSEEPTTAWLWDFGDGETSTVQNPSHVYTVEGYFTVSLTVGDGESTGTVTKENYIHISNVYNPFPTGFIHDNGPTIIFN